MRKILLTGATGFIGRNIVPHIRENFNVSTPTRVDLDLLDAYAVRQFLLSGQFDVVIHLANPTGHNPKDKEPEIFERSLRVFTSLESCNDLYEKMIYLGSGAEYGKHRDISLVSEEELGAALPKDSYGLSRYIMSKMTQVNKNIINLRLFACYGPGDPQHKLIPSIVNDIEKGKDIELNQDVWFDFLYVEDIYPVLTHFIENSAGFNEYNLCSGQRILISEIANEVKSQMGSSSKIVFRKEGLNHEYTGSIERLSKEIPSWKPRKISQGISKLLKQEKIV